MKNSELTYKEIYGQPQSFQAINNTLEDIYKVLDQVFAEEYDELIFTGCGTGTGCCSRICILHQDPG